jgi:prolyl-tRNA editing enzyme YbaK/EbsC (Cys-tRNA(Pro) deacylase)
VIGPTVAEAVVAAAGEDLGVAAGVVVAAHVVVIAAHAVVAEIAATARTAISKIAISLELRINALKCLIAILFFGEAALSCKRLTIHCGVTPLSAARHKKANRQLRITSGCVLTLPFLLHGTS